MTHDMNNPPDDFNDPALERIAADARRLPDLAPSRDLWAGIEARLDGATVVRSDATSESSAAPRPNTRRFYQRPIVRLAVAAAVLMAVTSTVTWQIARPDASPTDVAEGDALAQLEDAPSDLQLAAFTDGVASMQGEVATLERLVADRRGELDPQTVKILEDNLRVIDQAIAESRAALAADPASAFLSAQVARAYASKITLLRDAATLPIGL